MKKTIRWGILACGGIAHPFVQDLVLLPDAEVKAAASRTPGKAAEFAAKYNIPHAFSSYEELVERDDIDIIYVASTHNFHYENVKLCLNAGKPVLCEKPLTVNAAQAKELSDTAKKNGLFFMEAMWTRFIPAIHSLNRIIEEKSLGDVVSFQGDFCVHFPYNPDHRAYNKNLAGGALLDLGVYPISFARMIFGEDPVSVYGVAHLGETEVDEFGTYMLEFSGQRCAKISTSLRHELPQKAIIGCTGGYIEIDNFFHPVKLELHPINAEPEIIEYPVNGTGYSYEIEEAGRCLREGLMESPYMPHSETISVMSIMDKLRSQWGLTYPGEE